MSPKSITDIDNLMQQYIDADKTAGMVTLVSQHEKIVHRQAGGYQDIASQTPMSFDTLFRIYSMTKPITSVALMTLFEKGLFGLDGPAYNGYQRSKISGFIAKTAAMSNSTVI